MPTEMIIGQERQAIWKRTIIGSGSIFIALLLLVASARVSIFRYRAISEDISRKTELIKVEGETVGRRIEQLEAIRTARATGSDFHDMLSALFAVTPKGITYSQIELTENRLIKFTGQAESLSQPFLLPESLEKEPVFEQVMLRDAGQTKKAGGTVTEFRIDCKLKCSKDR